MRQMRRSLFPIRNFQTLPSFWSFEKDIDELFNGLNGSFHDESTTVHDEFKETDQALLMSFDMPGVSKDNLDVQVHDDILTITGKRTTAFDPEQKPSTMTRRVTIPAFVNREKIQAKVVDGVFYLAMPKVEKAQPQKIAVTGDGDHKAWSSLLNSTAKDSKQ